MPSGVPNGAVLAGEDEIFTRQFLGAFELMFLKYIVSVLMEKHGRPGASSDQILWIVQGFFRTGNRSIQIRSRDLQMCDTTSGALSEMDQLQFFLSRNR